MTFKEKLKTEKGMRALITTMAEGYGISESSLTEFGSLCYAMAVFDERLSAATRANELLDKTKIGDGESSKSS